MRYQQTELRERLAQEYALGTLIGGARRRFETLMHYDPYLRRQVEHWQHRLAALEQEHAAIKPPHKVWRGIKRQIRGNTASTSTDPWWRSRPLLIGVFTLLLFTLSPLLKTMLPGEPMLVVVNNEAKQPIWIIETALNNKQLDIKTLQSVSIGNNRACALWLRWDDGYTKSVGWLPEQQGEWEMSLPKTQRLVHKAKILVTLEPMEKPLVQPAEQVVFQGQWTLL